MGSEATLVELRNAVMPRRALRAHLQPLSRLASLQILSLCRVGGYKGDPIMAIGLHQLPTSLQASQRDILCDWYDACSCICGNCTLDSARSGF